jgi:hypothetical protein
MEFSGIPWNFPWNFMEFFMAFNGIPSIDGIS